MSFFDLSPVAGMRGAGVGLATSSLPCRGQNLRNSLAHGFGTRAPADLSSSRKLDLAFA